MSTPTVRRKTGPKPIPLADRFWPKVNKTATCWLWTAGHTKSGYGMLLSEGGCAGRHLMAHRVSYELAYGSFPDGLQVCHRCDTPACVRPEHLFLGTQRDNIQDCLEKGRWHGFFTNHPELVRRGDAHYARTKPELVRSGERCPASKLTEEAVLAIRAQFASGTRIYKLATDYGVTWENINFIVKRRTWRHLP